MKAIVSDRSKFENLTFKKKIIYILFLIKKNELGKSLNPCMKKVVLLKVNI